MTHPTRASVRDRYLLRIDRLIIESFVPEKFFGDATVRQRQAINKHSSAAATYLVSSILADYKLVQHAFVNIDQLIEHFAHHGWNMVNPDARIPDGAVVVVRQPGGERYVGFFSRPEHLIGLHFQFHQPYKTNITLGPSREALLGIYYPSGLV